MLNSLTTTVSSLGMSNAEMIPLITSAWTGEVPPTVLPQDVPGLKDLRAERVALREAALSESETLYHQALADVREANAPVAHRVVGAWMVARNAFMKGVNQVALETTRAVDRTAESVNASAFRRYFPDAALPPGSDVECWKVKGLHGSITITGNLFVTPQHVAYHNGGRIAVLFKLTDVVAVVECVALDTYDGRPFLLSKPGPNIQTNAIQLYLNDHRLAEFVGFAPSTTDIAAEATNSAVKSSRAASMCYVSLYNAWAKVNGGHSIVGDA